VSVRPVVTIHLPQEMGAVGAIMRAVAQQYPDAVVAEPAGDRMTIVAEADLPLTKAARRRMAHQRSMAARAAAEAKP
jgi:hypothetical protein